FFSLLRPRPRSTLFPYTTLFRSEHLRRAVDVGIVDVEHLADREAGEADARDVEEGEDPAVRLGDDVVLERGEVVGAGIARADIGDRKSTRLNSSHSQISYAVFCL